MQLFSFIKKIKKRIKKQLTDDFLDANIQKLSLKDSKKTTGQLSKNKIKKCKKILDKEKTRQYNK